MQKLAEICVQRPVFASVITLIMIVFGWVAYTRLGVDRFPKVDLPTITVTTRLPGAAPEELETEITDKIEEAVNTISGIDELRSTTSEGVSQVFITFILEKEINVAAQEVRDKVNLVLPYLPEGAELLRVEPEVDLALPPAQDDDLPHAVDRLDLPAEGLVRELGDVADRARR